MSGVVAASRLLPWRKKQAVSVVPPHCRVYAIGDIHGRSDLLHRIIRLIRRDALSCAKDTILVFVGDYVDRGPDSKDVIARLIDLQLEFTVHFLKGNHDQALLDFLENPSTYRVWREFGAVETLLSYGVRPPLEDSDTAFLDARDRFARAVPCSHREFLQALSLTCEIGDYFFTHAGVRPKIPLDQQRSDDLLWIREDFLNSSANFGKVIVHGHTPTETPVKKRNRVGIDTGAYFSGRLTAVVLEGRTCRFLQTP
jgi:serine/threonine protein phosphatase 1